ncbi:MAG: hypothetical protein JWR28_92 [Modestobacter sp.]|nr:hypothetical protein [Modestobacter sp.]MCW2575986.1 hypothetical protein [Modestobacter sp.]MCW2616943.1 hypothetical protein [Modestobacter sp.]
MIVTERPQRAGVPPGVHDLFPAADVTVRWW